MRHLILSLILTAVTFGTSGDIEVRFGPVDQGQKSMDRYFVDFVAKARETLDGAFYEIRLDTYVDAFIRAHERGVAVRLVVDSDNYYYRDHDTGELDYSRFNPFVQRLVEAGIQVKQDNDRSGLMHNKFAVRDSTWVWTGSMNLTDTGAFRNENNIVWFKNEAVAEIYAREFREMFEDGLFGIKSPSTVESQVAMHGDSKIEVFFGPEDDPMGAVERHLVQAEESVYFMEFAMTADHLGEVMVERFHSGVKVKGIFDRMLYRSTGPYAEFAYLTSHGVPVVVYDSPTRGKMHHKVFIIDAEGKDPKVILGSGNASANGNKANDENIMVIHGKEAAQSFLKQFRSLFGRTSRVVATFHNFAPIDAAERIPRLTLIVSSNGVATEKLKIQFPPRWPQHDESVGLKIYRLRNGRQIDMTAKEDFTVTPKDVTIHSANLAREGEDSMIIVKVTNSLAPEIEGFYNLYIKAKARNTGYYPLATQPVIRVGNAEDHPYGDDAVQILTDLVDEDFSLLKDALDNCKDQGICELLETPTFTRRISVILKQLVNTRQNTEAAKLLEELKPFTNGSNRTNLFEELYN